MHRLIIAFAFMVLMASPALCDGADASAPFGLTWGMSAAQVKALGVTLGDHKQTEDGQTYSATKLPKMISDIQGVFLYFGYNDKLWRIAAASRDYNNDPYGSGVLNRYNELTKLLGDKYGHAAHHESRDHEMWKAPNEFVMGIKVGRTFWYTNFDAPSVFVQIGLGASDQTTSYWRLIVEDKALRADFQKSKKSHEKDAL